jgi:CTP:molybdopterin cytidylyltransferase MocA
MDLAADLDASLLLSCDQPFVTAAVLAQLIQFAPNQWETDRRVSLRHDARNSRSL